MFLSPSYVQYTKPLKSGEGVEPEYFEEIFRNYFSIFITFSCETFEVEGEEGRTGGVSRNFSKLLHHFYLLLLQTNDNNFYVFFPGECFHNFLARLDRKFLPNFISGVLYHPKHSPSYALGE